MFRYLQTLELRNQGKTYREIADILNVGISTVTSNLHHARHPERWGKRRRKISLRYYYNHRGKCIEYSKKHHKKHPEKHKEAAIRFRRKNPERYKEITKKYYSTEKGKLNRFKKRNRRREKFPVDVSMKEFNIIKQRDKVCVYCGSNRRLGLDHVNPRKGTTLNNLVLACRSCNAKKGTKDVFTFCKLQGIRVPVIVENLIPIRQTNLRGEFPSSHSF